MRQQPLREAAERFKSGLGRTLDWEPQDWWTSMYFSQVPGSGVESPLPVPSSPSDDDWTTEVRIPDATIDGANNHRGHRSDDFFREVARVYSELFARTTAPAKVIAEVNRVEKETTVHYWIREARARGFLPRQGRRGKVG
ncbi:MAG: hypothetical protein H0U21_08095 [Acidimicrobiia bacterium]|nr:hypothetical protein [Acidimicrobiia bacterium]